MTALKQVFWGKRSKESKEKIHSEIQSLKEATFFKGEIKSDNESNYLILNDYKLPSKWKKYTSNSDDITTMAIIFPTIYPLMPPIGFYLKVSLPVIPKNPKAYVKAYELADKAFIIDQSQGYKWYYNGHINNWNKNANLGSYLNHVYQFLAV